MIKVAEYKNVVVGLSNQWLAEQLEQHLRQWFEYGPDLCGGNVDKLAEYLTNSIFNHFKLDGLVKEEV